MVKLIQPPAAAQRHNPPLVGDPRKRLVSTLCPHWDIMHVDFDSPFEGGYRNRNYRFDYADQGYVLRVPGHAGEIDRAVEAQVLQTLSDGFAPKNPGNTLQSRYCVTAEVIAFDLDTGAMISRFCPWPLLVHTPTIDGQQLGTYLATLHNTLGGLSAPLRQAIAGQPSCQDLIAADLKRALAPARVIEQLGGLTDSAPLTQLSHQDLNPWNLLLEPGSNGAWMTLDWETLGLNLELFDLVSLVEGYALAGECNGTMLTQLRTSSRDAYCNARATQSSATANLSTAHYEQALCLFYWREYAWAAAQVARGNRLAEIQTQRTHYSRLLDQLGFVLA